MGGDWSTIRRLLPYLWAYRWRVGAALGCLVVAKVANVGVPLLLKQIVDRLDRESALMAVPLALLVAYGVLRLSTTLFTELREFLFAKVTQRAVRDDRARGVPATCTRSACVSTWRGRPVA